MRNPRIKLLAGVLLAVATLRSASQAQPSSEVEAFKRLEREMFDAVAQRDLVQVDRIWADDFLSTNHDATVVDKRQWIEAIRSGQWPPVDQITSEDFKLRRYGDTAVVTGRSDYLIKGTVIGSVRHTQVWVKRKRRWQLVSWQGTPIPGPQGRPQGYIGLGFQLRG